MAAATMPRGAIHPMNHRSRYGTSVRAVESSATRGLTTRTSAPTRPRAGSTTWRSDCGVTVAEIEMNSSPMVSETSVSKKTRRAGMSSPGRLASAIPITTAAIRPVSSRKASHSAATDTTAASCTVVPSTSPRGR